MGAGEFAGWAFAILGVVLGAAFVALVVASSTIAVMKQARGLDRPRGEEKGGGSQRAP